MMKAFRIYGPQKAGIDDVKAPEPAPTEALVSVEYCGICGSDLHAYKGSQPFFEYPQIPGHEVVGTIVEFGSAPPLEGKIEGRPDGQNLSIGTRVAADPAVPCGKCYPCTHGRYNCCENQRVIGVHIPGALAEFFTIPVGSLHPVPDDIPSEAAALAEPLSIGVQANTRGRICEDDEVLIIGCGTIGLCVMLVAKARGAKVVMTDPLGGRRQKAQQMGADAAIDTEATDFDNQLQQSFEWGAPSVVVEAVGTPQTLNQALETVLPAGRVVLLGLISDNITIRGNLMVEKELDFIGSRLHGGTLPDAIELLADNHEHISGLITNTVAIDETEEAMRRLAREPEARIKTVVRVD